MELFGTEFLMSQVTWLAIWFVVLLAIMWRFVVPAVNGVLDARAQQIRSDLDRADQLKKDAEKSLAEYEKQLKAARQEAAAMVATAKQEADNIAQARLKELDVELKRKQANAEDRINNATQQALTELKAQVADMTIMAVEKVLAKQVDKKTAEKMADDAIASMKH